MKIQTNSTINDLQEQVKKLKHEVGNLKSEIEDYDLQIERKDNTISKLENKLENIDIKLAVSIDTMLVTAIKTEEEYKAWRRAAEAGKAIVINHKYGYYYSHSIPARKNIVGFELDK